MPELSLKSHFRGKAAFWETIGSATLRKAVVNTSSFAVELPGAWTQIVAGWSPSEGFGKGGPTTVCRTGVEVPVELGVGLAVMVVVEVAVEEAVEVGVEVAGLTVTEAVEGEVQLNCTACPLLPVAEPVLKL